jgi:uncharacterized protein (DUF697 family)
MASSSSSVQAHEVIKRHMAAGAIAGLLPLPWISFAALTAVQLNMLRHLASIYDVSFSKEIGASAIGALVGSDFSLSLSLGIAKMLPGPSVALAVVSGGLLGSASTFALGKVFIQHFESGNTFLTFDPDKVRAYYQEQFGRVTTSKEPDNFAGVRP